MQGLITDVVSIYHSVRTGSKKDYATSPAYTNVNACISPTGTDIALGDGGVPSYQLFEIFIYDTSLQILNGDKIETPTVNYLVDGVPYVIDNRLMEYIRVLARVIV